MKLKWLSSKLLGTPAVSNYLLLVSTGSFNEVSTMRYLSLLFILHFCSANLLAQLTAEQMAQTEADRLVLLPASKALEEKRYKDARQLYLSGREKVQGDDWRRRADLALAEIAKNSKDHIARRKHLLAAASPVAPDVDNASSADLRQEAREMLAWFYLEQQEYLAAQGAFTAWQPSSFCGNCAAELAQERELLIAFCRLHEGEYQAVQAEIWNDLKKKAIVSETAAAIMFEIYRAAKQEQDLVRILENCDLEKQPHLALQLKLQRLVNDQDIPALLQLGEKTTARYFDIDAKFNRFTPQMQAAAALANCVKEDAQPIIDALQQKGPANRPWLIAALGYHQSPAALAFLSECVKNETYGNEIRSILAAISQHGQAGKEVLSSFADPQKSMAFYLVNLELAKLDNPNPINRAWPKPKPYSLYGTYQKQPPAN